MNDVALTPNIPQYWENLYAKGKDDWSLGKAAPPLLDFFKSPLCPQIGDVLVPAAGRGFCADAWAKRGHKTVAVDFCPTAVDSLEMLAKNNSNLTALNLDIFLLSPRNEKRGGKKFDIIYDYCCFNSIHPGRRDECVEMWQKMLKDDGLVVGFFGPLSDNGKEGRESLPPYSISISELEVRLSGMFNIEERIAPKNSVKKRIGKEEIWLLRKIS
jgi:hypothetical protein